MKKDDVISTLNNLIETSKDGELGFRTCSEDAKEPELKTFLSNRADGCANAGRELQDLVRALGGEPSSSSSLSGTLHRRWVDIKAAILGRDDEAILTECERGEDVAKQSYRRALSQDLPIEIHNVIQRQYNGVLENHDMVKTLRDRAHAHS